MVRRPSTQELASPHEYQRLEAMQWRSGRIADWKGIRGMIDWLAAMPPLGPGDRPRCEVLEENPLFDGRTSGGALSSCDDDYRLKE
jgi:hypothetical protein